MRNIKDCEKKSIVFFHKIFLKIFYKLMLLIHLLIFPLKEMLKYYIV